MADKTAVLHEHARGAFDLHVPREHAFDLGGDARHGVHHRAHNRQHPTDQAAHNVCAKAEELPHQLGHRYHQASQPSAKAPARLSGPVQRFFGVLDGCEQAAYPAPGSGKGTHQPIPHRAQRGQHVAQAAKDAGEHTRQRGQPLGKALPEAGEERFDGLPVFDDEQRRPGNGGEGQANGVHEHGPPHHHDDSLELEECAANARNGARNAFACQAGQSARRILGQASGATHRQGHHAPLARAQGGGFLQSDVGFQALVSVARGLACGGDAVLHAAPGGYAGIGQGDCRIFHAPAHGFGSIGEGGQGFAQALPAAGLARWHG